MQDHFFISDTDGALHDTRDLNWSSNPLRSDYRRSFPHIDTLAQVKATLRAGPYAWPGGYQMYFITQDGAALSFEAVRSEFRQIVQDYAWNHDTGWMMAGCEINYEDEELYCGHTGKQIEAAYS